MNKREKILAAAVVTLGAGWAGNWLLTDYQDALIARRAAVQEAGQRLNDANLELIKGRRALGKMETWQDRSLPNNRERALSLYKAWLLAKASEAGLTVEDIAPLPRVTTSPTFSAVGYQIEASGSLSAVTAMLYEFYRSPLLHQVTRLNLNRPPGASQLDVTLDVEALSVPRAVATDSLPEGDSKRLKLASLEAYQKSLSERDLATVYSPPRPPRPPGEVTRPTTPPKFDDSEHAYFSGAVGSGENLQAWINVRTTGETLHLAAGDSLNVGTLEGQIVSVEPRSLVLQAGEKKYRVALGQTLRGGKELDAAGETPAPDGERRGSSPPG